MTDRKRRITGDIAPPSASSGAAGPTEEPPPSSARAAPPVSSRVAKVETRDLGEAEQVFGRIYTQATLEPVPGAAFGCALEIFGQGPVRMVEGHWPGGFRAIIPAGDARYFLTLSVEGRLDGEHAGRPALCVSGRRATLFSPDQPIRVEVSPASRGLSFAIERGSLEAQLRAMTGREIRDPVVFDAIDWQGGPDTGALLEILQIYRREVKRPDSSPIWLTSLRDALLTGILVNTRNSVTALLSAPPPRVAPASVRRAEEFIEAHAGQAITLTDIVAAVGVPARSLRAAFASSRGVTPMEFLRQCRLDLGRRMLQNGDERTTVAGVVSALGLGAAGRFSVEYRRRFGEPPSETLAAARRRIAGVPRA